MRGDELRGLLCCHLELRNFQNLFLFDFSRLEKVTKKMLIIQIKFKYASRLWQFHCKQHKKMEEIFLQYSRTSIWFNKEIIHIIDEWVGFLCICYFHLTVTENIDSYSCRNTTHSSVGTIGKLVIHKFSKKSTKAFWGNQLTISNLRYRIFYILILFWNHVLHVLYIKLAIFS